MKVPIFSFLLLMSALSYAGTCTSYFQISSITEINELSKKQLETVKDLALFEFEARAENNPLLKNQRLLEFQERLNEILQTGISIKTYEEIRKTTSNPESAKNLSVSKAIQKEIEASAVEKVILKEFSASTLTEALFKAFEKYKEGGEAYVNAIFLDAFLINRIDFFAISSELVIQKTFLQHAALQGDLHAIEILIARGVNIELADKFGNTPLHYAAQNSDPQALELLISFRANIEATNAFKETPLLTAARNSHPRTVQALLDHKANIKVLERQNENVVHKAVKSESLETLELLLDRGADMDAQDKEGNTPLHYFAKTFSMTQLLIQRGANTNIRNRSGQTPLDLARRNGQMEIAALLRVAQDKK